MIDRRPAIIVRCAGAADVIACVLFAREHNLLTSIRGGGHSVAGKSVCNDGLMIDLSTMKGIRVDPVSRTVRAQPGLTLGEFDRETQAFSLGTTLGTVSATGISGLTLGGGWGHLHGQFGLALDNLVSIDVVTADGKLLTASSSENEDLFWGVRGSGGNLGIVTSLEYQLHEVGPVLGGAVCHPIGKSKDLVYFFRDWADRIPVRRGSVLPRRPLPGRESTASAAQFRQTDRRSVCTSHLCADAKHVRSVLSCGTTHVREVKLRSHLNR